MSALTWVYNIRVQRRKAIDCSNSLDVYTVKGGRTFTYGPFRRQTVHGECGRHVYVNVPFSAGELPNS
jgi:hypothetical protein